MARQRIGNRFWGSKGQPITRGGPDERTPITGRGCRVERAIVNALQAGGFAAERGTLSGAAGGRYCGDIVLPLMGRDLCLEAKARADGFRELYGWLDQRDVLIVKADRQEALVVVRLLWLSRLPKRLIPR